MRFAYFLKTLLLVVAVSLLISFVAAFLFWLELPGGQFFLLGMPTVVGAFTAMRHHGIDAILMTIVVSTFCSGLSVWLVLGDASGLGFLAGPMFIAALIGVSIGMYSRSHWGS